MLKHGRTYDEVYSSFKWNIPEFYNMGVDICDKWASEHSRLALICESEEGKVDKYTFSDLKKYSNQLANVLKAQGIKKGDRVSIIFPQSSEYLISLIAIYKIGAIAVPLLTQFGPDALEYRLANCDASAVITEATTYEKVASIKGRLTNLRMLMVSQGQPEAGVLDFWGSLEKASSDYEPEMTKAEDPALIIYTSGTTGPPKGALHAHRVLLGHLPALEFYHNFFPKTGDLSWTPADWSWIGGMMDVFLLSLHHGVPVLSYRMKKFDAEKAFYMLSKHGVRNTFMPATILKMMRLIKDPKKRYNFNLRTLMTGGEALGEELHEWGREVLGLSIAEAYGQTEVHVVLGNCPEIMMVKPGSMGRPTPGHRVELIDALGNIVPPGVEGEIAVQKPDPIMFLGYWRNQKATEEKYLGDWCRTGDMAEKDKDGYYWFVGRDDDVIKSGGYRIGPSEVEDSILKHPAVAAAGVIGSPDEIRGVIVKAYIVLRQGVNPDLSLSEDIQKFVKSKLAAYQYPREIEFIKELPITATGKLMRKDLRKLDLERKSKG